MAVTNPTGKVEHYKGKVPRCKQCGKPLRPLLRVRDFAISISRIS